MRPLTERFLVSAPRSVLFRVGLGGIGGGALVMVALFGVGFGTADASATAFSLGALVFGFGLTTWATSLLIGNALQVFLRSSSRWSRERAASAFSVLTALGLGAMVGASLATVVVQALVV